MVKYKFTVFTIFTAFTSSEMETFRSYFYKLTQGESLISVIMRGKHEKTLMAMMRPLKNKEAFKQYTQLESTKKEKKE